MKKIKCVICGLFPGINYDGRWICAHCWPFWAKRENKK